MKKILLVLLAFVTLSTSLSAQKKFDYGDIMKGTFRQKSVYGVRSMKDGKSYTVTENGKIVKYSYKTGSNEGVIFDGNDAATKLDFSDYTFSGDEKKILFTTNDKPIYRHSFTADYWVYDIASRSMKPLSTKGAQEVATFSPDGTKVAFVRDNNLFWVELSSGNETQITTDGKFNHIINGKPDWVYEEEYGFAQAYQWAPDSKSLAYWKTDESRVKEYHMNYFQKQLYPTVYSFKYPKAGEQNSVVSIHTVNLATGATKEMNIGEETDIYVPRIKWTPDSKNVLVFRLNRLQNNFDMLQCDATNGNNKIVYNQNDKRYINRLEDQTVMFLEDGDRYIIQNEKDGYNHLYLYSLSKGFIRQITKGGWEVTQLLGVDGNTVYYMSAETSPIKRNLYSINLNGSNKKRITKGEGNYNIDFNNDFSYFISYFTNATTPNTVTLHTADGKQVRVLEDNKELKAKIADYKLPIKEFFSFTTPEGVSLNGYMMRPANFDAKKRYPVFMTQYSGPGSQQVLDKWTMEWEHCLVQDGYILVCVDGRGTGGRGEEFRKCTYRDLGRLEVLDQIATAKYLGGLSYVDKSRIAIYGWSYGGFMALNCILQGADVFKCAVAVAPVTSWRYYDTIYTEIYNGLPQDNAAGYDNNSPITHASKLKGKLLIAHGTGDDNVHIQNSMDMISALEHAGKQFDMAIYPDQNHSMLPNWNHRHNLMIKCINFVKANL